MITECRESIRPRRHERHLRPQLPTDGRCSVRRLSDPSSMPRPLCATLQPLLKRYSEGRAGLRHLPAMHLELSWSQEQPHTHRSPVISTCRGSPRVTKYPVAPSSRRPPTRLDTNPGRLSGPPDVGCHSVQYARWHGAIGGHRLHITFIEGIDVLPHCCQRAPALSACAADVGRAHVSAIRKSSLRAIDQ